MKKIYFLLCFISFLSITTYSQNTFPTGAGTYVGIGTGASTPATALHITKNSTTLNAANFITIENRGANASYTTTHVIGGLLFSGWRDIRNPANVAGIWAVRSSYSGGLNSQGDIVFGATNNPGNIATDNTLPDERMRITGTGNVGIGNNNPLTLLDVAGTVRGGTFMAASASPSDQLTHNGVSMSHYALAWANDSWQTGASTAWLSGYGGIKLFTGGTNRINVDVNGNVGIGKIATAKLDINGGVYANGESHYSIGSFTDPDVGTTHAIKVGSNGIAVSGNSVFSNGYVMIGAYPPTMNTSYLLNVNGDARVDKLVVNTTGADFVFEPNYKLIPLNQLETYVTTNRHLPGIETANTMQRDGVDVGDNQTKLLQKIEELTLYIIDQNKKLSSQNEQLQQLRKEVEELKASKK